MVPAISDYEVRRELLRSEKTKGLARLDGLKSVVGFIPLTSEALLQAAQFWAEARRLGKPSAPADDLKIAQRFIAGKT